VWGWDAMWFGGLHIWSGKSMRNVNRYGFTIIELLITIAILAVLLTVVLPSLVKVRQASRDGTRKTDIQTLRTALETFKVDHRVAYPTSDDFAGSGSSVPLRFIVPDYIQKVPTDPLVSQAYKYVALPLGCNNIPPNMCQNYAICAKLEAEAGATTTYCNGINDCGPNTTCNYEVQNK